MDALPPVAEAAIAVVLALSMIRAFFGSAPEHADLVAAGAWLVAGILLLIGVLVSGDDGPLGLILSAVAVEAVCVAGWWLRGDDDGGGEDDDGGIEPAPGGPPIDWTAFDRERERWRGPREPVS